MTLTLSLHTDIEPNIGNLILDGKLEGGYSIDYALNALVSYYNGKEVIIYDFNNYFILDNRKKGYTIEEMGTKILIKFQY
jgi:hypothetical protein